MGKRGIAFAAIAVVLCLAGTGVVLNYSGSEAPDADGPVSPPGDVVVPVANHSAIVINSDEDLIQEAATEGWFGNGTGSNPYMIQNYIIDAHGSNDCIYIGNTTVSYAIRHCTLLNASGEYQYGNGIRLLNSSGALVEHNDFLGNDHYGLSIYCSEGTIIKGNNFSGFYSILMNWANGSVVTDNRIGCRIGPWLVLSHECSLYNNSMDNCSIELIGDDYLTMTDQVIAINNTVNGLPVLYRANVDLGGMAIGAGFGQMILGNVSHALITGMGPTQASCRLLAGFSHDLTIERNDLSNSFEAIHLYGCDSIVVRSNNLTHSFSAGLSGTSLNHSLIIGNDFSFDYSEGLELIRSDSNTVRGNWCNGSDSSALSELYCHNNTFDGNHVRGTGQTGLTSNNCGNTTISNNTLISNELGIYLEYSDSPCLLRDNICSSNSYGGIAISYSSGNKIINNTLFNNCRSGLRIGHGSDNLITANSFLANYFLEDQQGHDDGTSNHWNGSDGRGNYWSDWNTTDSDLNGIVDFACPIGGSAMAYDYCPLWLPPSVEMVILTPSDGGFTQADVRAQWIWPTSVSANYEVRLDGGNWTDCHASNSYSFTGLSDGPHTVEVRGSEASGHVVTSAASFTVDTVPPSVVIVTPTNGLITSQSSLTISLACADNGSGLNSYHHCTISVNGATPLDIFWNEIKVNNLRSGQVNFTVRVWDVSGNTANVSFGILVDRIAPTLTVTSPTNNQYVGSTSVQMDWAGWDNQSGLLRYEVQGGQYPTWTSVGNDHTVMFTLPRPGGDYRLSVRACDNVGNYRTVSRTVWVDMTAPFLETLWPSDGDVMNTKTWDLTAYAYDLGSQVSKFRLQVDGGPWTETSAHVGYCSFTLLPQSEGTHHYNITVVDGVGNNITVSQSFYVDLTPPEVTILSPTNDSTFSTGNVTVDWTAGDDRTSVNDLYCEVWLDEAQSFLTWEHSLLFEGLSNGSHTIKMRSIDAGYNYGAIQTVSLHVDVIAHI